MWKGRGLEGGSLEGGGEDVCDSEHMLDWDCGGLNHVYVHQMKYMTSMHLPENKFYLNFKKHNNS